MTSESTRAEATTERDPDVLRVSRTTDPEAFGTALAHRLLEARGSKSHNVRSLAIGERAVNQMVKGSIIANGVLSQQGIRCLLLPYFEDVPIKDAPEGKTHYTGVGFRFILE